MFLDNAMERINRLILQGGRTGMKSRNGRIVSAARIRL